MLREHLHGHGLHRERRFEKGDIKYVILDLLKDKPSYGYEIIRALEERTQGMYAPSPGAVYPTLQMLEELGYVTGAERDGRKVYTITEAGRRFLNEGAAEVEGIHARMRHWHDPSDRRELHETMREVGNLLRLLGHEARSMDAQKLQRIRDVLTRARAEVDAILRERETPGAA